MPNIPENYSEDCEHDGVISTLAGIVGCIQANEVVKEILQIGESLCGQILIVNSLKLNFKKIKLNRNSKCVSQCIYKNAI